MKSIVKKISLLGVVLSSIGISQAQDIHFSQFYETGAVLNPGYTGLGEDGIRTGLQYRDQWSALNKTYRTGLFHIDAPLLSGKDRNANIGVGGYVFFDKAGSGALGQTEMAIQVSGLVKVGDGQWLSAGIRGAYAQYTANNDVFEWSTQFDGTGYNSGLPSNEATGMLKTATPDFSAGIGYTYNSASNSVASRGKTMMTFGAAYHHVATPEIGYFDNSNELKAKFLFMFRGRFDFGTTKYGILPVAYYALQHKQQEINVGAIFRYGLGTDSKYTGFLSESELGMGLMVRVGDAIIPTIRFQSSHFIVGISYDLTISKLGGAVRGNGGYEISLLLRDIRGMMGSKSGRSML